MRENQESPKKKREKNHQEEKILNNHVNFLCFNYLQVYLYKVYVVGICVDKKFRIEIDISDYISHECL